MKLDDSIRKLMVANGLDPDSLRAKRGKKRSDWPEPCARHFEPGSLLVAFVVDGRPVPWKAAYVTKRGGAFKDASLKRWQDEVRWAGKHAMTGGPFACPVELVLGFHLVDRGRTVPDVSNLTKATEDSLQGWVIVNDRQVSKITATRRISDRDFAEVRIYSAKQEA